MFPVRPDLPRPWDPMEPDTDEMFISVDAIHLYGLDYHSELNTQDQSHPSGNGFFKSTRSPEGLPGFLLNTTFKLG